MGLFEQFPYTNFHELNADWLLKKMKELAEAIDTFIAEEAVKFADPIIWNISNQYAKSTIVMDPSGNAYLSKQPVPSGVQLNNEDYWLEVFNFADYVRTANQNLTAHVEANTTRATADYDVDDWLLWDDVLYKVTVAIAVDDLLVVGTNLVHFTVEDFLKAFITYANGLIQQYKNDIDASELAYYTATQQQIDQIIAGATVDSEVINARVAWDGEESTTLKNAITTQVTSAILNPANIFYNPSLLDGIKWGVYGSGYSDYDFELSDDDIFSRVRLGASGSARNLEQFIELADIDTDTYYIAVKKSVTSVGRVILQAYYDSSYLGVIYTSANVISNDANDIMSDVVSIDTASILTTYPTCNKIRVLLSDTSGTAMYLSEPVFVKNSNDHAYLYRPIAAVEDLEKDLENNKNLFSKCNMFENPSMDNGDGWNITGTGFTDYSYEKTDADFYSYCRWGALNVPRTLNQLIPISKFESGTYFASVIKSVASQGKLMIKAFNDNTELGTLYQSSSNLCNPAYDVMGDSFTIDPSTVLSTYPTCNYIQVAFSDLTGVAVNFYRPILVKVTDPHNYLIQPINDIIEDPLKNKTIVWLGDSLMAAGSADVSLYKGYAGRLMMSHNMNGYNYALSGATITNGTLNRDHVVEQIDTAINDYPTVDYCIMEGGSNDADIIGGGTSPDIGTASLGSFSDSYDPNDFDDTTFYGALDLLFYKAINAYKGYKIGFIIPHKMGPLAGLGITRRQYFDICIDECKKWGIPYLDLWNTCYVNRNVMSNWYNDGQHLNFRGYNYITPIVEKFLRSL